MNAPFFTVGHSNRGIGDFIDLLRAGGVEKIIDVRTVPRSRYNPQYNTDTLPATLAAHDIGYEHMPALGGLRPKSETVAADINGFWENGSFHNYADYALSPAFGTALDRLIAQGRRQRCAVMCAEAVWWRCHRRLIADYLLARGEKVFHLMDGNKIDPARMTESARPRGDGSLAYPAAQTSLPWEDA